METPDIHEAFAVHMLNEEGKDKAKLIASTFSQLLYDLEPTCEPSGREWAIVKTRLEEAAFFAKKAMANQRRYQES